MVDEIAANARPLKSTSQQETCVIWANKGIWMTPGPIVAMGVLNAWSFAEIGLQSHFFIEDDCSGTNSEDDLRDFYGINENTENLHVHRVSPGGAIAKLAGRRVYAEALRLAKRNLSSGKKVLFLTRELGILPALAQLQKRYGNRLTTIHETHDFFGSLKHVAKPTWTLRRKRWCERRYLPKIKGVLCITPDQAQLYRDHIKGISVLALPLGCQDFTHGENRIDRRAVAYVGHLSGNKGVNLLIKAAPRFAAQGIKLHSYGGYPHQIERLKAKLAKTGAADAVSFFPFMPPAELHRKLATTAGAFLSPLKDTFYNRYLTCPVKALDALSHGLPTVASDLPSTRAVLGEAAVYVEPENLTKFVDATISLFDDSEKYAKLSSAAVMKATTLQWSNRASAILEWADTLQSTARP